MSRIYTKEFVKPTLWYLQKQLQCWAVWFWSIPDKHYIHGLFQVKWAASWQNQQNVRLSNIRISLGIRPVWSESSLCAQWVAKDPSFLHADSELWSDWVDAQADLSLCWAHMPFFWFCYKAAQMFSSSILLLSIRDFLSSEHWFCYRIWHWEKSCLPLFFHFDLFCSFDFSSTASVNPVYFHFF